MLTNFNFIIILKVKGMYKLAIRIQCEMDDEYLIIIELKLIEIVILHASIRYESIGEKL